MMRENGGEIITFKNVQSPINCIHDPTFQNFRLKNLVSFMVDLIFYIEFC